MRIWHVMALAAFGLLLPSATLKAQEAVKVGVCNPAKVFESMDERKVIEDKMKSDRDKAQAEAARTEKKLDLILAERKPELPANMEKYTADQIRQIISANDVLYANEKADITQE